MDAGNQNLSYPIHIYNLSAQQPPRNSLQAEQEIHTTAAATDGMQTVAVAMAVNEAAAGGAAAAEEGEQNIGSLTQAAQFHNHTQNRPFLHHDQNAIDSRNVHGGGGVSNNVKKVVRYRECRKNQAAAIGGYAIDGCGEFMPSAHQEFQCAACHCHRNFHRREVDGEKSSSDCQHARR